MNHQAAAHDPAMFERRNKLFMLLQARAFRRGRVVLASGKESDFYFDMKPAMLDPDGSELMAGLILHALEGVDADAVGGKAFRGEGQGQEKAKQKRKESA